MAILKRLWTGFKLLACYFLFLPCCPKIGDPEDADCIWVQAFGRNSFSDKEAGKILCEIRRKTGCLFDVMSLLRLHGFEPGEANRSLAKKAIMFSQKYNIPISAQWEVVYCLWEINRKWFMDNIRNIHCEWPPLSGYYSTRNVKSESREWIKSRGLRKPIEVAHPAMVAREVAIIWKLGIEVIAEPVRPWGFWKNKLWVWDKDSVQPWTLAFLHLGDPRKMWLFREILGRIHHVLLGWVSFLPPAPISNS